MKRISLWAACAAALLALGAGGATAQAQGVAIIDLSKVFKEHSGFNLQTDALKVQVQGAEDTLKAERDAINELARQLQDNTFKKGSPEYKQLEETVTKRQADLQAEVALQKKSFMEREAKIYYAVYQEIQQEVQYFCKENKISLVLRFNDEEADPNDPQTVLKQLNRSVFYHDRVDITAIILEKLNGRRPAQSTGRPGVTPRRN